MRAKKWIAKLLAAVMCCTLITVPVSAYERVNTEQNASLSLQYHDTERDRAISGLEMRLYKVADMSDSVRFTVTEDFADASVFQDESFALEELDVEKWAALADTLTAYVAAQRAQDDAITPAASGVTDEEGKLVFTELDVGLYLLEGDKVVDGDYIYMPAHYLLTLPTLNIETDSWEYDVLGGNKYTRRYDPIGGGDKDDDTISRNVMKVWEDHDDDAKARPESVTVQLLCDGAVYETVKLSEENHWKYSWVGLDADADWQLVELEVPEDYTVLVEQTGNTFVVTNTYRDGDRDDNGDDEEELDEGDVPTGGKDGGNGEDEVLDEDIPLGGLLPQTGVLWWPVHLLTIIGIALFALGWADGRKKKSEDA